MIEPIEITSPIVECCESIVVIGNYFNHPTILRGGICEKCGQEYIREYKNG